MYFIQTRSSNKFVKDTRVQRIINKVDQASDQEWWSVTKYRSVLRSVNRLRMFVGWQ